MTQGGTMSSHITQPSKTETQTQNQQAQESTVSPVPKATNIA
eukprot:CAMPEP_0184693222 /NCGR_PEP_ID=MMETSP0313-20130426/1495_1 /TAXON_ID=2792 /ORGANISM="Porphyridium aerugineum, Strain SAG 1380-2" /LENGTH=41 /DNA_ID= /DNA_START= /DNA_END= /DNA_ORIENTATION=